MSTRRELLRNLTQEAIEAGTYGEPAPVVRQEPASRAALRARIGRVLRDRFEYEFTAEWICCDPPQKGHKLCKQGHAALAMVAALLADDPPRSTIISAVMEVVGPAIERVHTMTDACDELLVRERAAHAKTAERAYQAEGELAQYRAAVRRVRGLITCGPMEADHDHVCPDTVLVTDVLAALGLAVLVAKPTLEQPAKEGQ